MKVTITNVTDLKIDVTEKNGANITFSLTPDQREKLRDEIKKVEDFLEAYNEKSRGYSIREIGH